MTHPAFKDRITKVAQKAIAKTELSQFLFNCYISDADKREQGHRSRISDQMAETFTDMETFMRLVELGTRLHGVPETHKVTAIMTQPREPMSITDFLQGLVDQAGEGQHVSEAMKPAMPQALNDDGTMNKIGLWSLAAFHIGRQAFYEDVTFDHDYGDTGKPAIRGDGVTLDVVNGAILTILGELEDMPPFDWAWFAQEEDSEGWVQ